MGITVGGAGVGVAMRVDAGPGSELPHATVAKANRDATKVEIATCNQQGLVGFLMTGPSSYLPTATPIWILNSGLRLNCKNSMFDSV